MPLIRASDFCRPKEIVYDGELEIIMDSADASASSSSDELRNHDPISDFQSCGASLSLLRSAHLIAGGHHHAACYCSLQVGERCIGVKIHGLTDSGQNYDQVHDPSTYTLTVSPVTAMNLGIRQAHETMRTVVVERALIQPLPMIPKAEDVVLMPVGRPLIQSNEFPLPSETTLIQTGTLLSVFTKESETYFYEVISVNRNEQSSKNIQSIFQATKQTVYRFANKRHGAMVPRLPCLYGSRKSPFPHPDLKNLVQSWEYANPPYAVSHLVHHLIGTEFIHHARTVVREAAKHSGRRCIWVPGLAAFGALQQSTSPSSSTTTVTVGGVNDKLAGLHAAIDMALTHAPSILLMEDIDQEFTSEESRVDLERRIWMALSEKLILSQSDNVSQLPLQVPAVLVVLTTARPLAKGALLQNLTWPSITLSPPNEEYIRHLWNVSEQSGDESSISEEKLLKIMKGRPAQEIVHIKRELRHEKQFASEICGSDLDRLQHICHQLDERRRHQSGSGRIPAVRWEDIGGLAHVRQEILDAIELPLNFPHLFGGSLSNNKGRSGILLYGPPGTGKTLVAKVRPANCNCFHLMRAKHQFDRSFLCFS
jgi:hypothetical protein